MYRYKISSHEVGKGLDPNTLAPAIYHKIIEFDHNILKVVPKKEIKEWMTVTIKDRYKISSDKDCFYIDFENDADYEWFALRWL